MSLFVFIMSLFVFIFDTIAYFPDGLGSPLCCTIKNGLLHLRDVPQFIKEFQIPLGRLGGGSKPFENIFSNIFMSILVVSVSSTADADGAVTVLSVTLCLID